MESLVLNNLRSSLIRENSTLVASANKNGVTFPDSEKEIVKNGILIKKKRFYPATEIHTISKTENPIPLKRIGDIISKKYLKGGMRFSENRKKDIQQGISDRIQEKNTSNSVMIAKFAEAYLLSDKLLTKLYKQARTV